MGRRAGRWYIPAWRCESGMVTVNLPDIVLLQKHLCNKIALKKRNGQAADLNEDGMVTIVDAILLKRMLL